MGAVNLYLLFLILILVFSRFITDKILNTLRLGDKKTNLIYNISCFALSILILFKNAISEIFGYIFVFVIGVHLSLHKRKPIKFDNSS